MVTAAERAAHNLTHMPFRSWCPHCIRGRGRNKPHLKKKGEQDKELEIPKVSMDYFFASQRDREASKNPVLVMVDETTGDKYARLCGRKGIGEDGEMNWLVTDICDELRSWGHPGGGSHSIIMKSDSEPAVVALREAVARLHGGRVVPERPPVGENSRMGT